MKEKKKQKKLCKFSKENFRRQEIFKRFSIDKLSQMTLALQKSFFRKKPFKKDKMRLHECLHLLFIDLNTVNQMFIQFYLSLTTPPPNV